MENYFNIRYEFDKRAVLQAIDEALLLGKPGYICVSDGVILSTVNRDPDYRQVVDGAMFSICDSGYVPLYLRWIYGIERHQYCGSEIFMDIVHMKRYKMAFLGTTQATLNGLQNNLSEIDPRLANMWFYSLPYKKVEEFDYPAIAEMLEKDGSEIIWIALGAPKQEIFMSKLKPYLKRGVMIAVGAAFKFYSGTDVNRAPYWMVRAHLEFLHRIYCEPKKQIGRCSMIVESLPKLLYQEWNRKRKRKKLAGKTE